MKKKIYKLKDRKTGKYIENFAILPNGDIVETEITTAYLDHGDTMSTMRIKPNGHELYKKLENVLLEMR